MAKKLNKKEIIKILVEEYGYEQEDIKMFTNAKLENMIQQEEEDAEEAERAKTAVKAKVSRFKDDDAIVVMNGFSGDLTHRSGTSGRMWSFKHFGQTAKIPYGEILTIRNNSPKVFENGWLVILNKQIQEDFGLVEIYKNILTPENIDSVFEKNLEEMKEFVENLPEEMKVVLVSKARELYKDKKLDSVSTIDYIENKFDISLKDNAPLSETV